MKYLILLIGLTACSSKPIEINYGPDTYDIKCIEKSVWLVSDHSLLNLGESCNE